MARDTDSRYEPGRAPVTEQPPTEQPPTSELPEVRETGTGWPEEREPVRAPVGTGGFLRGLFWLVAVIGVIMALVLGTRAIGWWPHLNNPFGAKQTDRSQPVLLKSIQDLSR